MADVETPLHPGTHRHSLDRSGAYTYNGEHWVFWRCACGEAFNNRKAEVGVKWQ